MREKLIELLNRWPCFGTAEEHADHLIANGVTVQDNTEISDEFVKMLKTAPVTILQEEPTIETVQSDKDINVPNKWISVKDRLPEEWVDVLVLSRYGFCEVAVYLGIPGKWRIAWNHDLFEVDSITHWMPLPQPPKGE